MEETAAVPERLRTRKSSEYLRYDFTEKEFVEHARQLGRMNQELARAEDRKKSVTAELAACGPCACHHLCSCGGVPSAGVLRRRAAAAAALAGMHRAKQEGSMTTIRTVRVLDDLAAAALRNEAKRYGRGKYPRPPRKPPIVPEPWEARRREYLREVGRTEKLR